MSTETLARLVAQAGKCSGSGGDQAFPEIPVGGWSPAQEAAHAGEFCAGCPVTGECLQFALRTEKPGRYQSFGVWGGTTPRQRQALLRAGTAQAVAAG
jgi:WhiB family transcriptional regulator, redox-sensing transcriptional regulator